MISVIIPIYKESDLLAELLESIKREKLRKEIIVVLDSPTKRMEKEISGLKGVKVFQSMERRGKAKACNFAVKESKGEKIVFLDADVRIVKPILGKISDALDKFPLVEVKKEIIRDSILSRITYVEYAINYATIDFLERNTDLGLLNGAAFGIRRKTFDEIKGFRNLLVEDTDLAVRVTKRHKFKFLRDVKVCTKSPKDLNHFIRQKNRWVTGATEIAKEHPGQIRKAMSRNLFWTILWFFLNLSSLFWLVPSIIFPAFSLHVIFSFFLLSMLVYFYQARSLGYKADILDYSLYYFVYSPMRLALVVYGFVMVNFFPEQLRRIDEGWLR
jgi:cellulose synthase/poly-beta-1,6-N-acetylglucosamine synthase-like glycosyltransferase